MPPAAATTTTCSSFTAASPSAHTPYNYAWGESGIDPVINASLDTLIRNNYSSDTLTYRLGVVVMDYYNNHGYDDPYRLSWQLINTNFKGKYIEIK